MKGLWLICCKASSDSFEDDTYYILFDTEDNVKQNIDRLNEIYFDYDHFDDNGDEVFGVGKLFSYEPFDPNLLEEKAEKISAKCFADKYLVY